MYHLNVIIFFSVTRLVSCYKDFSKNLYYTRRLTAVSCRRNEKIKSLTLQCYSKNYSANISADYTCAAYNNDSNN